MLMWFFLVFFGIGLILTVAGFSLDLPVLSMVGTIMIFLMGMGLLQDGLDIKTGSVESYSYGNSFDNFTGSVPDNISQEAYVLGVTVDDTYDHYNDAGSNRFGWLLMAMGGLGFTLSLFLI